MWSKYISTMLIAGIVSGVCSSTHAQITSSGKKFRFVRIGKLDKHLRIQAELNYTKHGDDISFTRGHLILGRDQYRTCAEMQLDYQEDILRFIKLVDELYTKPLGENDYLELELKPTIPNGTWYLGPTFTIQKDKDGYGIWIQGEPTYFNQAGGGWEEIDLIVFRETLAEVARAIIVEKQIPELPETMKSLAKSANGKIWKPKGSN